jgi:dnd system-associated protein 4
MNKIPDRLNISFSDKADCEKVLKDKSGPFHSKANKHIFMMALGYGYKYGKRKKLSDKKFGFVRLEYLNNEEISIINAIAVKEAGSLDILLDKAEVFKIAEEYANTGLKLILKDVLGEIEGNYGDYHKRLGSELLEYLESVK